MASIPLDSLIALPTFELLPCLIYGDSYSASDSANTPGARWTDRLARRTGLQITNHAVGGDTSEDQTVAALINGASALPENFQGVVINQSGFNNLSLDDSALTRTSHLLTLRTFVGLALAADRIEGETFTTTGWDTPASATQMSNGAFLDSGFTTDERHVDIAITTAGDYLIYVVGTDGTWNVAPFTVTQGGTTLLAETNPTGTHHRSLVSGHAAYNDWGVVSYLVRNVQPGTLRIQKKAGSGDPIMLDLITRVNRETPPLVVLTKPPLSPYLFDDTYARPALLAAFAANVDQIAAEFPEAVVVVDLNAGYNQATMAGPDGLHPNDYGSAWITAKYVAALRGVEGRPGIWRRD